MSMPSLSKIYKDKEKRAADLLIAILTEKNFCLAKQKSKFLIDENLLIKLAKRNKVDFCLFHFVNCASCKKMFSKKFIDEVIKINEKKLFRELFYKKAFLHFETILKKSTKKAIAYKPYHKKYNTPSDLDILLFKNDLAYFEEIYRNLGYKKTAIGATKEIQLFNQSNNFSIDLHFLLAYPHHDSLNKMELKDIENFGTEILALQKPHTLEPTFPIEHYLLSMMIRYWYNDLLCGIKNLYGIFNYQIKNQDKLNWEKFKELSKKYHFFNQACFIFLLNQKIFSYKFPDKFLKKIPKKTIFLANLIDQYEITIFPNIRNWNLAKNKKDIQPFFQKYSFIKLILDDRIPLIRLIRPRIIIFLLWAFLVNFKQKLIKSAS